MGGYYDLVTIFRVLVDGISVVDYFPNKKGKTMLVVSTPILGGCWVVCVAIAFITGVFCGRS